MKKTVYFLFAFVLIVSACDDAGLSPNLLTGELQQAWTHSFEEQEDVNSTTRIYRKSDSREFAVSRFRDAFEFKSDGTCRYLVLHPADAHYFAEGTYTLDSEEKQLRIFDSQNELVKAFEIVELQEELLIIKALN